MKKYNLSKLEKELIKIEVARCNDQWHEKIKVRSVIRFFTKFPPDVPFNEAFIEYVVDRYFFYYLNWQLLIETRPYEDYVKDMVYMKDTSC